MFHKLTGLGYKVYYLQTIPGWYERSPHIHEYDEIRGALSGIITFHFQNEQMPIEAGDILFIPAGLAHSVRSYNPNPFTAFKASVNGRRKVKELGDGKGSMENLLMKRQLSLLILNPGLSGLTENRLT